MANWKRKRGQFSTEEKAGILRRHMVDRVPVSDLCNELVIQPSLFYYWQRQALENLAAALSGPVPSGPSQRERSWLPRTAGLASDWPGRIVSSPRFRPSTCS